MVTDEGGYGRFGALSRVELERFFYLDDEDRRLIAARRRDYNRLGFALQVVTVRQLGMFLADPLDVPAELIDYLAEQLGIEESSCVKQYTEREKTKLEHAWEIQREYGLTLFADVESELAAWVADQAWMTGDGPKAMFAGAVEWLRTRQALLPGPRTLERLVTDGRQAGDQRLWGQLTQQLAAWTSSALLSLLDVPEDGKRRVSELERLRKGVFRPSSKGMVAALDRLADLIALGGQDLDVSMVPQRRVIGLATYGLSSKAPLLRRLDPREYRLAVMVATVKVLTGRATDGVLELFDLLMVADLMSKAERESRDEKLRRYPRVSRYAGKLASAVKVLLEMTEAKPDLSLDMMWDLIENTATQSELRAAVAVIGELVPVDDAELNGQRLQRAGGAFGDSPRVPAVDDAHGRVRRDGRRCAGAGGDEDAGRVDGGEVEAAGRLPRCPQGRPRPDRRGLEKAGLPGGSAGGNGGPRRLHAVPAGAVPPPAQAPQHLRRRHRTRWRDPARAAAHGRGVGTCPRDRHERAEPADRADSVARRPRDRPGHRLPGGGGEAGRGRPASVDEDGKLHVAALDGRCPTRRRWSICGAGSRRCCRRSTCPSWCWRLCPGCPVFTEAFTHVSGNTPGSPISGCRSRESCARTR